MTESRYDHLSVEPSAIGAPSQPTEPAIHPDRRGSAESATTVSDNGDPLVPVTPATAPGIVCVNAYAATGWAGTSDTVWLRSATLEHLHSAAARLPMGLGLAIFDGWRSITTIRSLYDHFYGPGSTLEPGFLADPDDDTIIPPHLTGGAVDVTLTWRGQPLSLGTAFDDFTPRAHLRSLEERTCELGEQPHELGERTCEPDRSLRRLLYRVMTNAGFAPFDLEWWHYSWGDQDWSDWTGSSPAIYGSAQPATRERT